MTEIQAESLTNLLHRILTTRPEELGCETCCEELGLLAELESQGEDAATLLPLVRLHLENCQSCNEEYAALLDALKEV
ncbi:MAG TPA: hypothetical protein VI703_11630 [Anaerolineales bacterium]|nr:hypothetical protein [Anaerolineales bacterium]